MKFMGLDIETTGLNYLANHRLIQFGTAEGVRDYMSQDIFPVGPIEFDPEAMAVNGFTRQRVFAGKPQLQADVMLAVTFAQHGYTTGSITPVGWNVGSFDLHFVKMELPRTAEFFSHRVVDLTSVFIVKFGDQWRQKKTEAQKMVEDIVGEAYWHDAGFDAMAALLVLKIIQRQGL